MPGAMRDRLQLTNLMLRSRKSEVQIDQLKYTSSKLGYECSSCSSEPLVTGIEAFAIDSELAPHQALTQVSTAHQCW